MKRRPPTTVILGLWAALVVLSILTTILALGASWWHHRPRTLSQYLHQQVPRAELTLQNLWWPYRVLSDTSSGRSFVLTHRGTLWELGFEQAKGLGQVCQSDRDCAQGLCGAEGVCCNRQFCGNTPCTTCLGAVAGTCEPVYGPIAKDVDNNPCTSQSCVAAVGVVFQPLAQGAACADGSRTTIKEGDDHSWEVRLAQGTTIVGRDQQDEQFGWQVPRPWISRTKLPSGLERVDQTDYSCAETGGGTSGGNPDESRCATFTTTVSINGAQEKGVTVFNRIGATPTVTSTSPSGRVVKTELNPSGLVERITAVAEDGEGNALLRPTHYTYDDEGRVETVVRGPSRRLRYTYDASGGLEEVISDSASVTLVTYRNDAIQRPYEIELRDQKIIQLHYDDNNNVTELLTPSQSPHQMGYSTLDQLLRYTPPGTESAPPESYRTTWEYDSDYQLRHVTAADGRHVDFGYDAYGRLATVAGAGGPVIIGYTPATGTVSSATRQQGERIDHLYDGTLPDTDIWSGPVNATVSWAYNNRFLLEREIVTGFDDVTYGYDIDGLLMTAGPVSVVRHPKLGRIEEVHVGALIEELRYNDLGEVYERAVRVRSAPASDDVYFASYARDALGRLDSVIETDSDGGAARTFGYHLRGWLTSMKKGADSTTWEYDDNGNRQDPGAQYDAQDRMTSHGLDNFTYTSTGELASKTTTEDGKPDQLTTYAYDMFGSLHSVQQSDGTLIEYEVDAYNRRIQKRKNGQTHWSAAYRSPLQPVLWYDADGFGNPRATRFIYVFGGNSPDLMVRNDKVYRFVTDHVGSVRLVIDVADGKPAQRIDYDAWGNIIYDDNPEFQPFGFAGGIHDRDTGLVRLGSRDYAPAWGRWTTKDPLRFGGGSTNLYLYANSDPVNWVDPGGRAPLAWWFLSGMVAAAPFVENCDDWGGHVGMVEGGLWTSGLGLAGEALAGRVAARFPARGGRRVIHLDNGVLRPGSFGGTTASGEIYVAHGRVLAAEARRLGIPFRQFARQTLRHEIVHRYFGAAGLRGRIGMAGYNHSNLLRALEEGIAEGYATGSVSAGLRQPFIPGYNISRIGLGLETGAYFGGIGTAVYLGATQ